MTWISSLKKFRGRETGEAGLYRRTCRNWIYQKFRGNFEKRTEFFEKRYNNQLTIEDFKQLLSDASLYIAKEERDQFLLRFISGDLTDDEFNHVLKYAIPDMFYMHDMITCVNGNPELKKDYNRAVNMLMTERKTTQNVLSYFWHSPEYEEYKNNGHTEEELWQIFMDAAKSYGVYPLYCDIQGDGKYKLLDMKGYLFILEKRMRSIASEVTKKAKDFVAISEMFPTIKDQLPIIDGEVERLRPFDTLKLQPPQYVCPLCQHVFKEESFFKRHLQYEHKAQSEHKTQEST